MLKTRPADPRKADSANASGRRSYLAIWFLGSYQKESQKTSWRPKMIHIPSPGEEDAPVQRVVKTIVTQQTDTGAASTNSCNASSIPEVMTPIPVVQVRFQTRGR